MDKDLFGQEQEEETAADIVAQYLTRISIDADFVNNIITALQTEDEIEDMKYYLEVNPYLVPAEVYDILETVTGGRFKAEFAPLRQAKLNLLADPTPENKALFLSTLKDSKLITLANVDMTDPAAIPTTTDPIEPVMLTDPDSGNILIPVFSSELEVPAKRSRAFMLNEMDIDTLIRYMEAVEKVSGNEAVLVLDMESAASVEFKLSDMQ